MLTTKTIRELGGEIWAELRIAVTEAEANWVVKNKIVDITMAVLARYDGTVIQNDADFPVEPLPRKQWEN